MADLAASDLTYTLLDSEMQESGRVKRRFSITTAAGDYPTGGLPLSNAAMGYQNNPESVIVLENDPADHKLQYTWDRSANTLIVYEDDGTTGVPAEHANAAFTSPDQLVIEVSGW